MSDETLLPGGVLALSAAAAGRLIDAGSGDAALLYLQLLRAGRVQAGEADRAALRWDAARMEAAQKTLLQGGLIRAGAPAPAAAPPLEPPPPEYTTADLNRELADGTSLFSGLVAEVERRLGKVLSVADLKTLYTLYDYQALPAEVILLLISWCIEEHVRKYGPGQLPRMSTIRRQGQAWKSRGIDTAEAAEEFLRRRAALDTSEGRLLALVGITGRRATDRERPYLERWLEWGFGDEVIRLAYERTLFQKQNMNWNYMNSILKSWQGKGLRTLAEIEARDSRAPARVQSAQPQDPRPSAAPGEAERRVREDLDRMRAFMRQQKAQEGGDGHGV